MERYTSFSSSEISEPSRHKAIAELYERHLLPTKFIPFPDAVPHVDLTRSAMAGLGILTGTYGGVRHQGMRDGSDPRSGDDLFLAVTLRGVSLAHQRGREVRLQDGDGTLMTLEGVGWTIDCPGQVDFLGLRLPRAALSPIVPNLDDVVARPIPRQNDALKLLRNYIGSLASNDAIATPQLRNLAVMHVYDIVALALGASRDAAALAAQRGVRAARLHAIKSDIVAHLHDGDLSPRTIAAKHRMSARYLHRLFEGSDTSYSEFVLRERLAEAYRRLTNPVHPFRTISAIAFEVGFNDLSYFNRSFRRRYDATPSEVRTGARDFPSTTSDRRS